MVVHENINTNCQCTGDLGLQKFKSLQHLSTMVQKRSPLSESKSKLSRFGLFVHFQAEKMFRNALDTADLSDGYV